jgi:hypothetical protein
MAEVAATVAVAVATAVMAVAIALALLWARSEAVGITVRVKVPALRSIAPHTEARVVLSLKANSHSAWSSVRLNNIQLSSQNRTK